MRYGSASCWRRAPRRASSASARSRVMTPSAWPVVTGRARSRAGRRRVLGVGARSHGDRQAELAELEQESALGGFGGLQLADSGLVVVARACPRQRAGHTQLAVVVDEPIAPGEVRIGAAMKRCGFSVRSAEGQRLETAGRGPEREQVSLRPGEAEVGWQLRQAVFSKKTSWPQFRQEKARKRARVAAVRVRPAAAAISCRRAARSGLLEAGRIGAARAEPRTRPRSRQSPCVRRGKLRGRSPCKRRALPGGRLDLPCALRCRQPRARRRSRQRLPGEVRPLREHRGAGALFV